MGGCEFCRTKEEYKDVVGGNVSFSEKGKIHDDLDIEWHYKNDFLLSVGLVDHEGDEHIELFVSFNGEYDDKAIIDSTSVDEETDIWCKSPDEREVIFTKKINFCPMCGRRLNKGEVK